MPARDALSPSQKTWGHCAINCKIRDQHRRQLSRLFLRFQLKVSRAVNSAGRSHLSQRQRTLRKRFSWFNFADQIMWQQIWLTSLLDFMRQLKSLSSLGTEHETSSRSVSESQVSDGCAMFSCNSFVMKMIFLRHLETRVNFENMKRRCTKRL